MGNDKLLKIEEVAIIIQASTQTINNWYRWKNLHPESEYAKLLPEYIQEGSRQTRYWKQSDMWNLIKFKQTIPKGRNGILGDVTQIQARKDRERRNGKIKLRNK